MGEEINDLAGLTIFHKLVLVLALLSGAGNGAMGILSPPDDSDRYRGADAAKDLRARDNQIIEIKRRLNTKNQRITELEHDIADHHKHSAKYTQFIEQLSEEFEELKAEVHMHQSGGMHKQ